MIAGAAATIRLVSGALHCNGLVAETGRGRVRRRVATGGDCGVAAVTRTPRGPAVRRAVSPRGAQRVAAALHADGICGESFADLG